MPETEKKNTESKEHVEIMSSFRLGRGSWNDPKKRTLWGGQKCCTTHMWREVDFTHRTTVK